MRLDGCKVPSTINENLISEFVDESCLNNPDQQALGPSTRVERADVDAVKMLRFEDSSCSGVVEI